MKYKLESRFLGEISTISGMQMITTLMAESKEELNSLLMKVKEESEKADFKHPKNEDHGIRSHHFIADRWGNNENSERLFF